MTMPDERFRAVVETGKFLTSLLTTPRVPKVIRAQARACLRHYPTEWEMSRAAESAPTVFATKMEPVYRIVKQYEQQLSQKDDAQDT